MLETNSDRKSLEKEQLTFIIRQWNDNRVDLFQLSEPNEDLEFHGVMRYYFQDAGQKVATKCIRVASTASSQDVIQTLIEKFRPDFRMLSLPEYALYEIHESGEERKLSEDEKPLLVQLNWHKDDREGRFLLRRMDEKTYLPGFDTDSINFKRRLSKKKKKEKKKREKKELKECSEKDKDGIAQRLYTEIPETSFTRSISNPEAVMRRRRQQKLEKKLQQLCQEGGPEAGGTLRIFGESLNKDVPYKTLLLSTKDTAAVVVKEILNKYGKDKEDPTQFCLVQIVVPPQLGENGRTDSLSTTGILQYIVDDDDCPLFIEKQHDRRLGKLTFHIKRRPADYQPRKRKKKPEMIKGDIDPGYTKYDEVMEKLPYLEINSKLPSENHMTNIAESVGSETSPTTDTPTISEERDLYEHPAGPEIVTIQLQKSNNCMGLSIVAAKGPHQEKMGIYIKSVVKGGAADLDGRLQAGDQLLKVDGHSLIGISQERAAELITQTGSIVTLEVARQAALFNGLALLLNEPSPLASRGLTNNNPARRMSEAQIPVRPRYEGDIPRQPVNGYNGYPPHMQPYIRQPSRSVPTLNSNVQEAPPPESRSYPSSQPPHSRTSSTTSIPRSVAENPKQMPPMQQLPYKQLPPETLPPNGTYPYPHPQFQHPRSPSVQMQPPYNHSNYHQRPEIHSAMTLPNHAHQMRYSEKDRAKLPPNSVPPHLPPHVTRMQQSKSVPSLNNDADHQARLDGKPYTPHPAQYNVVTSTTMPPRYIMDPVNSKGYYKYQRPPEEDPAVGYRQMYNQPQIAVSTSNVQPQYNSNANLSRPNSQMSVQSQPNQRASYQAPYPEERHYQNISMYLMNSNGTSNSESQVNMSQHAAHEQQQQQQQQHLQQQQQQQLLQQQQFRQKLLQQQQQQQRLQQLHQQQLQQQQQQQHQQQQQQQQQSAQHMQHQQMQMPMLHPNQAQAQQQQMQQLLHQQRLQRLKLEEIRRQQELQLAQQAEERLLREAKRRQGEEIRQNKNQPHLRFELPNNQHSDDIPPPLPKSPPPIENNAQQRLDRLLLSANSASSDNLDKNTENAVPVKTNKPKEAPTQVAPKPKVSWNDSSPTVLNLETTATNGPTNNVHSFTLQDIDEVLDIEDDPEFSNTFSASNTPNVIGAQEVYKDPRERIKAEKMRNQQQKTLPQVPEKLSFKEKMKMFAMEAGQEAGIKDKVKISKAQREIETGPNKEESDSEDDLTTEENKNM